MSLKDDIKRFWNDNTCEINNAKSIKYSKNYFEEIRNYRYFMTPEIFDFVDFSAWNGKKVLEVGVGAGTDFIEFSKNNANITGIDLTENAIEHAIKRLEVYGLEGELLVADAESLPFEDNTYDLVYSWGVLHHTPDTEKAISEIVRVTKRGGSIKIMLYNRYSIASLFVWLHALAITKRFVSLTWALSHGVESIGTKAYTFNQLKDMFKKYQVCILKMEASVNKYDYFLRYPKVIQLVAKTLINLFGKNKVGYFTKIDLIKI